MTPNRRVAWSTLGLVALAGCAPSALAPTDLARKHARAGAVVWWYGNDTIERRVRERPLTWLLDQKCAVRQMGVTKSAFFVRVAARVDRALRHPAFAAILKARAAFPLTPDSGAQIMDRLRWTGVPIDVFMYERDGTHPCHDSELVDGHTNAFTPMPSASEAHLLFLYEPYVVAAMKEGALAELGRTIVHEALHSLGYSHARLEVGSEAYNSSVPLYVGCMIEHWGGKESQDWIERNCHQADGARAGRPPGR
jgi:hypothetical protein